MSHWAADMKCVSASKPQAPSHLKQEGSSMLLIPIACSQHFQALLTWKAQRDQPLHLLLMFCAGKKYHSTLFAKHQIHTQLLLVLKSSKKDLAMTVYWTPAQSASVEPSRTSEASQQREARMLRDLPEACAHTKLDCARMSKGASGQQTHLPQAEQRCWQRQQRGPE